MEREKKEKKIRALSSNKMTRKEGRLVEGGRPNKGREWTRPEREGGEPRRTNNLEGEKNGDPAPRTSSRLHCPFGGNFAGEGGPGKKSHGARIAAAPARGPVLGDPQAGEAGAGRPGRGESPPPRGAQSHRGPQTRGPAVFGPQAAGGSAGEGPPLLLGPFHHRPQPLGLSLPPPPAQDRPFRRKLGRPPTGTPTGTPPVPPGSGLPASPTHTPAPSLTHLGSTGTWATPGLGPR